MKRSISTISWIHMILLITGIFLILYCLFRTNPVKEHFEIPNIFSSLFHSSSPPKDQVDPSLITISPKQQPDFAVIARDSQVNRSETGLSTNPPPSYPNPLIVPNVDRLQVVNTHESSVNTLSNPVVHPVQDASIETGNVPQPRKALSPPQSLSLSAHLGTHATLRGVEGVPHSTGVAMPLAPEDRDAALIKLNHMLAEWMKQDSSPKKTVESKEPMALPASLQQEKAHSSLASCKFISTKECPATYPNDSGAVFENGGMVMCPSAPNQVIRVPKLYGTLKLGSLVDIDIVDRGKHMSPDTQIIVHCEERDKDGLLPRLKPIWSKKDGSLERVEIVERGSGLMSTPQFQMKGTKQNAECRLCCSA
jgi:hypothetical protein